MSDEAKAAWIAAAMTAIIAVSVYVIDHFSAQLAPLEPYARTGLLLLAGFGWSFFWVRWFMMTWELAEKRRNVVSKDDPA